MTTRLGLTEQERAAFAFIRETIAGGRLSPTYQEIMEHLGLASKSDVFRLVRALTTKGYIVAGKAKHRSIALVPGADSYTVHLPADLDARLTAYLLPWAGTPEAVITRALDEYLGRHA